jgi:rhodanese-related sulfurtransferase
MNLTPAQLAARLRAPAPPHLLDVRQPEEHAFAALPGAQLIPLGELPERFEELPAARDTELVVYCHHGVRSAQAAGFLRARGFTRVGNLAGGLDRWSLEVDPAVPRY